MAIATGYVTGWRYRRKNWYPTDGSFAGPGSEPHGGSNAQASKPESSSYNHTICFKMQMPTINGTITSITIPLYTSCTGKYNYGLQGIIRTKEPLSDSSETLSTLRSNAVTSEASCTPPKASSPSSYTNMTLTVTGTINSGGTYYLYLYSVDGSLYRFEPYGSSYPFTVNYNPPPTYTITFNANGGTVSPTSTTHTNGGSTTLPIPTRDGYNFVAWVDNPQGAYTREYYSPFTENLSSNITMYAWWSPKTYSVSYNANGRGSAPASQTKTHGVALTLQPFISQQTATGYAVSFNANGGSSTPSSTTSTIYYNQSSWNTNSGGSGTSYSSSGSYTANSSATLYAIWGSSNGSITLPSAISKNSSTSTYTISYNVNGGNSAAPSAQTLTRTTPYSFSKWAAGSTSGTQYSAGASFTPSAATTMYAIWTTGTTTGSITLAGAVTKNNTTASGYKVSFNANGGSCSTSSLTATDTIKWSFAGWNTNSGGTGTNYSAGSSYSTSANATLYAKWTSSVATRGSITLPTATRDGYNFKGWSTSSSATSGSTGSYTPSSSHTLYAVWELKTYTISYNANGHGTAPTAQTKSHGVTLGLRSFIGQQTATGYKVSFNANNGNSTPSALTSTIYYNQTYWNTNSSGTGTNYGSGASYTSNASATLYAIWKTTNGSVTLPSAITRSSTQENGYTVTFNANGGTCSTTSLQAKNTRNYTFSKWAAGSTSGTKYNAGASFAPSAATTMYATWTESVTNGSISLPTPTRTGYTFMGWSTSSTATSGSTGTYTPSGNVTLYATWKANGAVQIDTGTGHQMALVYIHNGTEYVLAIPYVHDGTEWKMAIGG